jgi:uncharacterized protein DUF4272
MVPVLGGTDVIERLPLTPGRAARRALILSAVGLRGSLERERPPDAESRRGELLRWLTEVGLDDECEDDELALLDTEIGSLDEQSMIDAVWRSEGAVALGWGLGVCDLPPHDEVCAPNALHQALGLMQELPSVLRGPALRPTQALSRIEACLGAVYARLEHFSLRPGPAQLAAFVANREEAEEILADIDLIEGDLPVDGLPLHRAEPEAVAVAESIAVERLQAVRWLGRGGVYSETELTD